MTPTTMTNGRMPAWMESAWMARYLDRQLTDEETATFEAYVLDKPELVAMLDADGELRDALGDEFRECRFESGGIPIPKTDVQSATPTVTRSDLKGAVKEGLWRFCGPWAAAAALVLGLGAGWSARLVTAPLDEDVIVAAPARTLVDDMRGPADLESREISRNGHETDSSTHVLFEIPVSSSVEHPVLLIEGRKPIALERSGEGFLTFFVRRTALEKIGKCQVRYELTGRTVVRNIDLLHHRGDSR